MTPNNIKAGFKACGIFPVNLGAIPDQAFHTSIPFDISLSQSQSAALSASASTSTGICSSAISSPTSSSVAPAICTTSSSSSLSEIPSTVFSQPTSASSASITPSDILNSSVPPSDMANSTDSPPGTLLAEVTLQAADPNLTDGEFTIASTDDLLHLASVLDLDLPISSEINDIFSPKPHKSGSSVPLKKRKITSHRLLTSDEIIQEKKIATEERERKEIEKEKKNKRERRKKENNKTRKIKSQRERKNPQKKLYCVQCVCKRMIVI